MRTTTSNPTIANPLRLEALCRSALTHYELIGNADATIGSICDDSRSAESGSCFVAVRGHAGDAHQFIGDAVQRGAVAIVAQQNVSLNVSVPDDVAVVRVTDSRVALAKLSAAFYGLTDLQKNGGFAAVGITGTNGKSTVAYLVRAVLQAAGRRTALLGTIEYDLCGRKIAAPLTTPGPIQLAQYLVEAAGAGADSAVLEASSHALDQHRTDGIRFTAGVFTNLTGDHRDYHPTQEHYLHAKKRLFDGLEDSAVAVINADDPAGPALIADCSARVLRYGTDPRAALRAESVQLRSNGSSFLLNTPLGEALVRCSLIGQHNISNVLAAAGVATAMGIDPQTVARGIGSVGSVRGRLERISDDDSGVTVLVDYAHTDDALDNVLRAVKPVCDGRLILVFGCGGDRDRSKRPRMAKVAEAHADEFVLTSDNPRTEDPQRILDDVLAGFSSRTLRGLSVERDRRAAIELAIAHAQPGDTVLIAGKGHEDYQLIGNDRLWFDDAVIARQTLHLTQPTKGSP